MLKFYLFPISYAFLTFPVAALLFTLPFLIIQYRRHGYVNKLRGALLYLFLLYLMNALFLVLLPLPASRHNAPPDVSSYMQWIPFNFIQDMLRETRVVLDKPSTYMHIFQERAFLQVLFNVCLVVPFGMFLRYYLRARWIRCLIASFGLSLFFEVTQVTGIYGIYDYPYRLFDVDDLLLNTLGGLIGFITAEWLSSLLPRIDKLDDNLDLSQKRVSYTRRGIALMLDWIVLLPVLVITGDYSLPVAYVVVVIGYFIIIPYCTNGQTLGKLIVRIRIKGSGEELMMRELAIRSGLLYVLLGGLNVCFVSTGFNSGVIEILFAVALFVVDAWFTIHLLIRLFNRDKKLFYEAKSGTTHIIS
ncbi:VanZ family protein [Paenibacillus eucommiae]|uniref:Glycopeptide antibiotics resistance protein n=1 Tax=Paenibacillus eucommiae TaxID=1355755 RepID=A0ABS4ITW3_9BACL|nr:VanZ family protein [Paenibacillus eucommiae]MBP1991009.1 glycopeptide antibiotics resistance protein [Paenibacillus eucommiae]